MKEQVNSNEPIQYFQPGQVVFRMEHKPIRDRNELFYFADNAIKKLTDGQVITSPEGISTFPLGDKVTSSLFFTRLANEQASSEDLIKFLEDLYEQLKDYEQREPADGEVLIRDVSPNWLMSSAQRQIAVGGPGATPAEADPPVGDEWKFTLRNPDDTVDELTYQAGLGEGIHVAILDTLPCSHDLVRAYFDLVTEHPNDPHPLLKGLLGPGGALHTYPADPGDLIRLETFALRDNLYLMPDHGLFVAGIIHSIAPAATLHLYEVLNAYGVGDLQTITNGLIKALENPLALNHKLVINLSLVFNLPYIYVEEIQEMEQPGRRHSYAEPDFPVVLLEDEKFLDFLTRPARQFFALIIENGNPVVAAAGNDAIRNNGHSDHLVRPPSRYPAAFDHVIGVGALPRTFEQDANGKFKSASYSNLSDKPARFGYATLGGEPESVQEKGKQGILGVYISKFPPTQDGHMPDEASYKENASGWARWSGTSFAAPVISGLIAARISQEADIQAMLDSESGTNVTPENEKVIRVIQGP